MEEWGLCGAGFCSRAARFLRRAWGGGTRPGRPGYIADPFRVGGGAPRRTAILASRLLTIRWYDFPIESMR